MDSRSPDTAFLMVEIGGRDVKVVQSGDLALYYEYRHDLDVTFRANSLFSLLMPTSVELNNLKHEHRRRLEAGEPTFDVVIPRM